MLMWEDGVARTLDLSDGDAAGSGGEGDDDEPAPPGRPLRATAIPGRFAAVRPGDR
jgi:hypothetical protein